MTPRKSFKYKKKSSLNAKNADKHKLYEQSVQCPEADIEFIEKVYEENKKKAPYTLREDFCGTAKMCCEWVENRPEHSAIGLDLDQPTLDWGIKNNLSNIPENKDQILLLNQNVLESIEHKADVICSFNFSYCIFKEREVLKQYFKKVLEGLNDDGMYVLDIHGGTETYEAMEEEKEQDNFSYVWDQDPYCPITGTTLRHIHFTFQDGSKMEKAFTYDWRLWSIPEITDLLNEAGFSTVGTYWEGADEDGDGDGNFELTKKTENETSWIAYVVAFK